MRKLWEETTYFLTNRIYVGIVSLVAIFSYGFAVTHPTVGIDDTAIPLYFEEGLAPAMGRWVLFLLNRFINLSDFLPWMTEVVSIILLIVSVTLWCVLWRRLVGEQVSMLGYAMFAAVFLSCPLISEVYVYYLHNGICMAYGITALALMAVLEAVKVGQEKWRRLGNILMATVLLTVALGCYESFIIVFAIGVFLVFFLIREGKTEGEKQYIRNLLLWVGVLAAIAIASVLLRTIVLKVLQWIYGFSIPDNFTVGYRNILENWGQSISDLFMAIKKFWVMYYLNGICYLPIAVLVLGICVLLVFGLWKAIRKKDIFLFLSMLAIPIVPLGMVIIEGMQTHYRASQYVPLVGAFAIFMLFREGKCLKLPRIVSGVGIACVCVLLWNQTFDMNQWFYIDYLKYEDAKKVMSTIAYDLKGGYDTSKPIVFRGAYYVPHEIAKEAYLSFDSDEYRLMKTIADVIDAHLLEKFNAEDGKGYVFAETPINSTLRWGVTAFDGTAGQLQVFWEMHGYSLRVEINLEKIAEAEELRADMPSYPQEGYIREYDEYIIVNF